MAPYIMELSLGRMVFVHKLVSSHGLLVLGGHSGQVSV
jgi:hypothetical protein